MMPSIRLRMIQHASVPLSCAFIDRYLANCTPVYALIYIYGLRHCQPDGQVLSTLSIAETFRLRKSEVLDAWRYWESAGLVQLEIQGDELASISFTPMAGEPQEAEPTVTTKEVPQVKAENTEPIITREVVAKEVAVGIVDEPIYEVVNEVIVNEVINEAVSIGEFANKAINETVNETISEAMSQTTIPNEISKEIAKAIDNENDMNDTNEVYVVNEANKITPHEQISLPALANAIPLHDFQPIISRSVRPQYTVEELALYRQQSPEIARLFRHAEKALVKMLTYHDLNILFGFYDWLRLPVDVVVYLLSYCAEGGHHDLRYMEKVALDWADRNIKSLEAAEAYTATFSKEFRDIMASLGNPGDIPTSTQRKHIDKWTKEYGMSLELVLAACEKAEPYAGKSKLAYIDKIMTRWNNEDIRTLEAVEIDAEKFKNAANERREALLPIGNKAPRQQRRNRFANFKPRERDYAQIKQLEREILIRELGDVANE